MLKKRRVRDDLSKNHLSVQGIPRSQLFELSGQLLHSGFGELDYFVYHPTSESLAFHSRRPITSRLLFRLTNNLWVPFKGKQEDFPFLKNATGGVIEKIMLKISTEEEETRKNTSADTTDIQQSQLLSLMEQLAERLAEVHLDIDSLRSQLRDAREFDVWASNYGQEMNPSDTEPKGKGNNGAIESASKASEEGSDSVRTATSRPADTIHDEAVGSGISIKSLRVPRFCLATANEIPMKLSSNDAAPPLRRVVLRGTSPAVPHRVAEHPAAVKAPPMPPAGYRVAREVEFELGKALVGKGLLYYWPKIGWVRGCVHAISRSQQGYSHLVKYGKTSAIGPAVVASLLDAASHGPSGRWVLLLPNR